MQQRRRAVDAGTNEEIRQAYDDWAATYDDDVAESRYSGPQRMTREVQRFVPQDARVLDAGAGTGVSGEALHAAGYRDLVGIDLSARMLEAARAKGVYRELRVMTLGERLDFPDDSFDAAVSMGVFTVAHAPASSFDELVRVVRPGGHVIVDIRPENLERAGFSERFRALAEAGAWELAARTESAPYIEASDEERSEHQIWVHRVLGSGA